MSVCVPDPGKPLLCPEGGGAYGGNETLFVEKIGRLHYGTGAPITAIIIHPPGLSVKENIRTDCIISDCSERAFSGEIPLSS